MGSPRVLVIGGNGFFGRLLVEDLRRHVDCEVVIAGRSSADLWDPVSLERAVADVSAVICVAGPYQQLPITLAELCLRRDIHYFDFADDRGFVERVRALVEENERTRSAVCTAWSTVSALSGLLAGIGCDGMNVVNSIRIQMVPGNRGARHAATIASLLHSVGQPFTVWRDGNERTVTGWTEPREFDFPQPLGRRRGYLVDVPDHEIFPRLFHAATVEFRAGAELEFYNRSLEWLARTRRNWVKWAVLAQRAAALLSWMGHDWGAIGVEVSGSSTRRISVVGESQGERIAVMPASVMTARLLSGFEYRGLMPYAGWLTEDELRRECERRGFRLIVEDL